MMVESLCKASEEEVITRDPMQIERKGKGQTILIGRKILTKPGRVYSGKRKRDFRARIKKELNVIRTKRAGALH